MTIPEMIDVLSAHMEGKKIQSRGRFESGDWKDNNHPEWQFGTTDYRVAPEPRKPREWLAPVNNLSTRMDKEMLERIFAGVEIVRVREVLENE